MTNALHTHIESRTLLISMVHQSLEHFANEMYTLGRGFVWDGGLFIGKKDLVTQSPVGNGIFISKKKNKEAIVAKWDRDGLTSQGVKL